MHDAPSNQLGIGKIRGLTQLSTPQGGFSIVACDQRGALMRLMQDSGWPNPSYNDVASLKTEIIAALSPHASGVLLDPETGLGACIATRALDGTAGLVVALEETGYEDRDGDRHSRILAHWSVDKIRAVGASAVKLLVYFNPNREQAAAHQIALIQQVAALCEEADIPFMLETLVYPTRDDGTEANFVAEKPQLIIESARILSPLKVDLYKVEFPMVMPATDNPATYFDAMTEACSQLDEACASPWALLSAGVNIDTFKVQLEAACRAGASGFVCGRAVWRESVTPDRQKRQRFIEAEMVQRMRDIEAIVDAHAQPWFQRASHAYEAATLYPERWYETYAPTSRRTTASKTLHNL